MKTAICDDDKLYLRQAKALLEEVFKEKKIEYEIESYTDAKKLLESNTKYDMVFLDVEMGEMTGIEVAEAIHNARSGTLIFFVTNYEGYMDAALNEHAFRFWVKPMNRQRLMFGIESAIKEINAEKKALHITRNRKSEKIMMQDIIYVYAKNKNTCIVTVDEEIEIKEPFRDVTSRLNKDVFCSSHASYCINLSYVTRYTNEEVICRYGDTVYSAYMSKRKYPEFKAAFLKWAGEHI